jgi:hypothetical protein
MRPYLHHFYPTDSYIPSNRSDRSAKQRWANNLAGSGWSMGLGGIGGQIISGAVKKGVGKVFG